MVNRNSGTMHYYTRAEGRDLHVELYWLPVVTGEQPQEGDEIACTWIADPKVYLNNCLPPTINVYLQFYHFEFVSGRHRLDIGFQKWQPFIRNSAVAAKHSVILSNTARCTVDVLHMHNE